MSEYENETVVVTGANAGLGFEAAAQFAERGYGTVVLACRTEEKAEAAAAALRSRTGKDVFATLAVDVADLASARAAADALAARASRVDVLVLNAGLAATERSITGDGIELTLAASLAGHHVLATRLLAAGRLAANAHIIISGSEGARGDMPGFALVDYEALAAEHFEGDAEQALLAIAKGEAPARYDAMPTYATAKLFVAWWAAALARRVPPGVVVNAVSPGSAPGTTFARNTGFMMRNVMVPMMKWIGPLFGMAGSVQEGASRYVEAAELTPETSGLFFASPGKKLVGPIEPQPHPQFADRAHQEAALRVLERVTGEPTPAAA